MTARSRIGAAGAVALVGAAVGPLAAATALAAQEATPRAAREPAQEAPQPSTASATHLLVVGGIGGMPEYVELFREQGRALVGAARAAGLPEDAVTWLTEDPSSVPGLAAGPSTREAIDEAIAAIAGRAGPADGVLVVLVGHGTASAGESRFNLPGPDLTPADLAGWLRRLPVPTVAIVNTSSASGGFVDPLSGDGRIVITATRSPREAERTHFAEFFVAALAGDGADTDKNGRVSLLEAFVYARDEVTRRYEREGQLLTEHAVLEDDGDGEGSLAPSVDGAGGDGRLAAGFHLAPPPGLASGEAAGDAPADPHAAELAAERARLEKAVATLRGRRESMEPAEYDAALEALLVELAEVNRAARDGEATP